MVVKTNDTVLSTYIILDHFELGRISFTIACLYWQNFKNVKYFQD